MSQVRRVALQPAFLLHQRPYRDTSKLIELLTRDYGRVALVARGARSPRSSLRSVLQPFQPLLVSWSARSDLGTLRSAEAERRQPQPPGRRLYSAWYLNELLLRLTERDDHGSELYGHYCLALGALCDAGADEARTLRLFEKRLLDALGYGLELRHDAADGTALSPTACYRYELEHGAVPVADAAGEMVFAGGSLLSLGAERLEDAASLRDARRLLAAALRVYLGPRPLQVRRVMESMGRYRAGETPGE